MSRETLTSLSAQTRAPLVDGCLVEAVEPFSPAEKAGLRVGVFELTLGGESVMLGGDIITEMNGSAVANPAALETALASIKVGDVLRITISRNGELLHVDVPVEERPLLRSDIRGDRQTAVDGVALANGDTCTSSRWVVRSF
jgi:S1-C subfamily serine protease